MNSSCDQIHWSNESGSFPGRSTLVEEEKEERNYLKVFEQKYILNLFSKISITYQIYTQTLQQSMNSSCVKILFILFPKYIRMSFVAEMHAEVSYIIHKDISITYQIYTQTLQQSMNSSCVTEF
jgi:hypothetical protein